MPVAEIAVPLGAAGAIAFLAWFFFGPKQAQAARVKGNVQEIEVTVKGGYSPDIIRVQKGVPLRLIFDRQEAGDCSSRIVFQSDRDGPHQVYLMNTDGSGQIRLTNIKANDLITDTFPLDSIEEAFRFAESRVGMHTAIRP